MDKEQLAAKLRKTLNVDIRFEKLSKKELEKLHDAIIELVNRILAEASDYTAPKTQPEDKGPLGFGILPAIRDNIAPVVRDAVRNIIGGEAYAAKRKKTHKSD